MEARLENCHRRILDTSKKLSVLVTLYGEEDVVVLAFQDFVLAIKDLLAIAEEAKPTASSQQAAQLQQQSQVLGVKTRELNDQVKAVVNAAEQGSESVVSGFERLFQETLEAEQVLADNIRNIVADLTVLSKLPEVVQRKNSNAESKQESPARRASSSEVQDASPPTSSPPARSVSERIDNSAPKSASHSRSNSGSGSIRTGSVRSDGRTGSIRNRPNIREQMMKQKQLPSRLEDPTNIGTPRSTHSSQGSSRVTTMTQPATRARTDIPAEFDIERETQSRSWPRLKTSPYVSPPQATQEPPSSANRQKRPIRSDHQTPQFLKDAYKIVSEVRFFIEGIKSSQFKGVVADLAWVEHGLAEAVPKVSDMSSQLNQLRRSVGMHEQKMHEYELEIRDQNEELESVLQQLDMAKRDQEFTHKTLEDLIEENTHLKKEIQNLKRHPSPATNGKMTSFISSIASPPEAPGTSSQSRGNVDLSSKSVPTSPETINDDDYYSRNVNSDPEDIDYQDIFQLKQDSESVEEAQKRDKDATAADRLLRAIEDRRKRPPSRIEANVPVTAIKVQTAALPLLASITNQSQRESIAATKIQRQYRGHHERKKFKHLMRRKLIVQELLETEMTYVKGLLNIYRDYVIPLRLKSSLGRPILPKDKLDTIFFHIKEIMTIHVTLLGRLERRISKWNRLRRVGDVFIEMTPQLEMYTHYVTNYNRALSTYQECQAIPAFRSFLSEVKAARERLSLGLEDLLITPIQRIPRYVLLLKEMLKHTEKRHPDNMEITHAIERLQTVASFINEKKRESEKFNEVIQIQSRILNVPFVIAQANRTLIMEGELAELSELGKKKSRHLFLFNDVLVCTQVQRARFTSSTDKLTYEYRWSTNLGTLQFGPIERIHEKLYPDRERVDDGSFTHAIGLAGDERRIVIANSGEEQSEWLRALEQARTVIEQRQQKSGQAGYKRLSQNLQNAVFTSRFVMRKMDYRGTAPGGSGTTVSAGDTDMKDYIEMDAALKVLRERTEQLDRDILVEQKVLAGLQRLDQVYGLNASNSNPKTKVKVMTQKEETTRVLKTLQAELDRLAEVWGHFEVFWEQRSGGGGESSQSDLFLDKRDFLRVMSEPLDEKQVIRYLEVPSSDQSKRKFSVS